MGFVAAARRSGVRHFVKLYQFAADEASPVRFLRYHAAAERAMLATGLGCMFLRPNPYQQGLLASAPMIKAKGRFYAALGDVNVSIMDARDNATVAAAALPGERHAGRPTRCPGRKRCRMPRWQLRRPTV